MKKYIIIPCILSIIGHGLFFGVFKTDVRANISSQDTQLYLITKEQFAYLNRRTKDVVVSPLPGLLSSKNSLWKDVLDIVDVGLDVVVDEDTELLEDSKGYNFQEIEIPIVLYHELIQDVVPLYSEGLLLDKVSEDSEYTFKLKNNIQMGYYIQGPILSRRLLIENVPEAKFDIDKGSVKARFRFWVAKDGRVNQVIIEEGSSFPLIDSSLVNFIKTWRFSPATSNYEWGIVRIRFLK